MKKIVFGVAICSLVMLYSCTREFTGESDLDSEILDLLAERGYTLETFTMPEPGNLADIPQSMDNPLSPEKIALGASIFWDPVFHTNTFSDDHLRTATCGSCHIKDGHAGIAQGLGEGGMGTGLNGNQRIEDPDFLDFVEDDPDNEIDPRSLIDAQIRRPPTNMNVAYKVNTLWDGALGSPDLDRIMNIEGFDWLENHNEGIVFDGDLAGLNAFPGFTGAEVQAMAGLQAHRYHFNEELITNAGYREEFLAVFGPGGSDDLQARFGSTSNGLIENGVFKEFGLRDPDDRLNDDAVFEEDVPLEFSRLAAGMAVAAYNRHVLSNDAPFQKWLRGADNSGFTESMKRGFVVFLESGCVNCHVGPALTDADFHRMGTNDLIGSFGDNNPIAGNITMESGFDEGRSRLTGASSDQWKFLTPTLYNVPRNVFHGGQELTIRETVEYMLNAENGNTQNNVNPDEAWNYSIVSEDDITDLVNFIDQGLREDSDVFNRKYRPAIGGDLLPNGLFSQNNTLGENGDCIDIFSPNNDELSRGNTTAGADTACNGCVNCP